jgi:glutaredoxin
MPEFYCQWTLPGLGRQVQRTDFVAGKPSWARAKIRRAMLPLRNVIVYSRKGCHLCEVVKESLVKLSRRGGFTWHEVDVDADSELRRQFNDEVPVVFIDGRKAFKYRMDEQEFLRKLAS